MLSPNLDNPAMAAIAASVETALRSAGYVMILCDTHDRAELQDEYLHAMRSQVVQGYVLVNAVQSEALSASVARGDPIVFVGRRNPDGAGSFVGIDNRRAGADAADHLWARGIRDLAVIHPTQGSSASRDRVDGFVEAPRWSSVCPVKRSGRPSARACHIWRWDTPQRKSLLTGSRGPEGLFCPSDIMAYGAYRLALEKGVRIPEECTNRRRRRQRAQRLDCALAYLGPHPLFGFRRQGRGPVASSLGWRATLGAASAA